MSEAPVANESKIEISSLAAPHQKAKQRTLEEIESLNLGNNLLELEVQGFTILKGILTESVVERAKQAILKRVENKTNRKIDPNTASAKDFYGMQYEPYLLFDDPVFQEILLEPKPLALMSYLLGEDCILSSMGCHFRGPGGFPLPAHSDTPENGFLNSQSSPVANCNYALTDYTQKGGALVLFPGSHNKQRQPPAHENWTVNGMSIVDVLAKNLPAEEIDAMEWEMPTGGVVLEIDPGDAVLWHGNSWHAGYRRDIPGTRINLAAYFCRPFMTTQELRGDKRYPEVFERYADTPRFAQLLGENVYNGWREEGPDFGLRKKALSQDK